MFLPLFTTRLRSRCRSFYLSLSLFPSLLPLPQAQLYELRDGYVSGILEEHEREELVTVGSLSPPFPCLSSPIFHLACAENLLRAL